MSQRHPAIAQLLRWFEYDHLPDHLRPTSQMAHDVAHEVVRRFPDGGPELTAGLRLLLMAKDCFVRVAVDAHDADEADEADDSSARGVHLHMSQPEASTRDQIAARIWREHLWANLR